MTGGPRFRLLGEWRTDRTDRSALARSRDVTMEFGAAMRVPRSADPDICTWALQCHVR